MATKKRKATLPRVTVLAYRRADLVAFVQAVETLRLLVQDLRTVAEDLKQRSKPGRKPKKAGTTEPFQLTPEARAKLGELREKFATGEQLAGIATQLAVNSDEEALAKLTTMERKLEGGVS